MSEIKTFEELKRREDIREYRPGDILYLVSRDGDMFRENRGLAEKMPIDKDGIYRFRIGKNKRTSKNKTAILYSVFREDFDDLDDRSKFKKIPGYDDYFASIDGEIWSLIKGGYPVKIKTHPGHNGYLHFSISKKGEPQKTKLVHIAVCEAFHGPKISEKMQVRHLNGITTDNRPENLCWGTAKENMQDRKAHGTWPSREKHPSSILKEDEVLEIIKRCESGELHSNIAKDYGVSRSAIVNIVIGRAWGMVDSEKKKSLRRHFSKQEVLEIVDLIKSGMKTEDIAVKFDVHWVTINDIKRGASWKKYTNTCLVQD